MDAILKEKFLWNWNETVPYDEKAALEAEGDIEQMLRVIVSSLVMLK